MRRLRERSNQGIETIRRVGLYRLISPFVRNRFMKLELRRNLFSVLAFVGFIWLVWLVSWPLAAIGVNLNDYGLRSRTLSGLAGIFTMPFLHDSLSHLLQNTVPLTVLLLMLALTRQNARRVLICLMVVSGAMLWVLGWRDRIHVGSSALVYAMAAYLIAAGLYERKLASAATAILVGVLYGSLFWGLFPTAGQHISWEGHLFAAVAGALFAHLTLRKKIQRPPLSHPENVAEPTSHSIASV